MIYKMELSDSFDTMIFPLLEVPIEDKDVSGIASNTTIDGNVFNDYLWLKKQYVQKWSIMCQDEYNRLRGFWTRQFGNAEVPFYRLFYGENRYEDRNTFTVNGFVQIENDAPLYSPLSLTQLLGNATQETLSGKNLFNLISQTGTSGGLTNTWTDNTCSTTGSTPAGSGQTASTIAQLANISLSAGTYTMSVQQAVQQKFIIQLHNADTNTWNWNVASLAIGSTSTTFTINYNADQARLAYSPLEYGTTYNLTTKQLMLEKSATPTAFEPYVGGVPMPNPQFPSPVNVVSGAQTVKITGKNQLEHQETNWAFSTATLQIGNTASRYAEWGTIAGGQQFTISRSSVGSSTYYIVAYFAGIPTIGSTAIGFDRPANDALSGTYTAPSNAKYAVVFYGSGLSPDGQLEYSPTPTTYEPYHGQSYTIDLGSEELAKIGTYQDYIYKSGDKWYKHAEIGKVVLDGSESWSSYPTAGIRAWFTLLDGCYIAENSTTNFVGLSDYYIGATQSELYYGDINAISFRQNQAGILIKNKDITTVVADFEAWLASHNTTVYYALATPTDTEITDADLIEQLDFVASLYEGVNNLMLIPSAGAQGEINFKYRLNYEQETDIVPKTPVVLTLSDGGVINACGCRQNIQLIMRETKGNSES